jgi:hypothetical protein
MAILSVITLSMITLIMITQFDDTQHDNPQHDDSLTKIIVSFSILDLNIITSLNAYAECFYEAYCTAYRYLIKGLNATLSLSIEY